MATYTNQREPHLRRRGRSAICVSTVSQEKPSAFEGPHCQKESESHFFPGDVLRRRGRHPFLLCAQYLLQAIVILSSGSGRFLHLPRWRAAIKEQVPVDLGLEEDKV